MQFEGFLVFVATFVVSTATPLDDYVQRDDGVFSYSEVREPFWGDTSTLYFVNMTSQRWLTDKDCSRSVWWHYVVVTVPHEISYPEHAYVYVTGGSNHDGIPTLKDSELLEISALADDLKLVTAILYQIPNAPIIFWSDPEKRERTEDAIIAYTWAHFSDYPSQPDWLARMPMTKAVVAAMNMTADIAGKKRSESHISKFFIGGASKRGWTTWTTAAVDNRVVGITPIVMDLLNLVKNVHHQFRALGNWTFAFEDYYDTNFTCHLDDPNIKLLADLVDPFSYRDRLVMPKYEIDTGGDEFFMPDDSHYWFSEMKGDMYFRMIPNAEHSCALHEFGILVGIKGFVLSVLEGFSRPKMTWTLNNTSEGGSIVLHSPTAPLFVQMWHATTIDGNRRRDFRLLNDPSHNPKYPVPHPVLWFESSVTRQGSDYIAERQNPKSGWTAFFIEAVYPGPLGSELLFTTEVNIIPNTFPYPDCHGDVCCGGLV
ncbi:autocrine proliferation repressor protein A-like [Corticium candelabrum]|uniref:autocrine proliferation repressor protein A-like n=1 Tax=Corticium candelabrum TaxID=121492 RepID=UPI002E271D54|nr:autocrine proliferation repressor protein A-like [Corticium candelabrum]